MKKITFRRLTLKDIRALTQFFGSLSERTKQFFHPHKFDRETAEEICRPRKDYYYGLFYSDEIMGYSMLRGFGEGYEIPSYGGCIADGCQGYGLGTKLLDLTIEEAEKMKCKEIILKVYQNNDNASRIYQKAGFYIVDIVGRQYKMKKRL